MKAAASVGHRSESGPHLLRSHICSHSLCARLMRQIPSIPPSGEHSHVQAALQVLLRPLPPVPPPHPVPRSPLAHLFRQPSRSFCGDWQVSPVKPCMHRQCPASQLPRSLHLHQWEEQRIASSMHTRMTSDAHIA